MDILQPHTVLQIVWKCMMPIGKMRAYDPNLVDPWTKPTWKNNFNFAIFFSKVDYVGQYRLSVCVCVCVCLFVCLSVENLASTILK